MRGLKGMFVVFAVVVCGVLALGVGSALGANAFPLDGQLAPTGSTFGRLQPGSVAVDDASGETYVADSGSGVVDVFETATGTQLASWNGSAATNPPGTPAGSFGGDLMAVAANNGTGVVYVLDSTDNVVDVFDSLGGYTGQITGGETPAHGFSNPGGIAVDEQTGEVYVVDAYNGVVDIFSAAGAYTGRQIALASIPGGFVAHWTRGIAIDDFNGNVYVSDSGPDVVYAFSTAGEYIATWTGANTPAGSFGGGYVSVAADDAGGEVYVTDTTHRVTDVFAPTGSYLARFGHSFNYPLGTAVDQASGRIYVSDNEPGVVDILGPALVVPDVTTGSASEVRATSATLGGTVNPQGIELKDCHFEYGTEASYGHSAPCVPAAGSIPADSSEHSVSAQVTGLTAGSTYHFRLVAANANDVSEPNAGEDATFQTPPTPSIEGMAAVNVAGTTADLNARINPNGFDTTYRLEWGTSTAYGTIVPVPDADVGAGSSAVPVATHLSGLSANTTYHWRVVARSENGTTASGDQTFIYDTAGAGLPDGRAYEMVTPPRKNGAIVEVGFPYISLPDISEDGSRMVFDSLQCFAGSESCTAERQNNGDPYLTVRTSGGWVTSPLAPSATRWNTNSAWGNSAAAGTALFSMPTAPGGEDDWYVREANGSFLDIGPVTPPGTGGTSTYGSARQAATSDLSNIVWEAGSTWPFDQGKGASVYEYAGTGNSAPELVGVSGGAGSTDLISTCGTSLGAASGGVFGVLSADGGTVYFTAMVEGGSGHPCPSGSGANAGIPVPADTLYARLDGSRTVPISRRSPVGCTGVCQGSPPGDAGFEGASADGSKAFFTDTQQLTDGASEDSQPGDSASRGCAATTGANGCNLYEYDFANPAGENLVAVSAGDTSGGGPRVQGVMAISPDGSHVYFLARGVLSGVANSEGSVARAGVENLYVFERDARFPNGHVAFVATLPVSDRGEWTTGVGQPANVTPDGRFLVFTSSGDLTADTSSTGVRQVFRYDALTGQLVRISVGNDGFNDNGNAGTSDASIVPGTNFEYDHLGPGRTDPTMSHDGSYVFFMSPVGLAPHALNGVPVAGGGLAENVYEWHEGHVYLISDGRDLSAEVNGVCNVLSSVCLIGADGTGANVFFMTAAQLVPQDTDTQVDIYDARICTAVQPCVTASSSPVSCEGEACRGVPAGTPSLPAPASASFSGAGNLPAAIAKPVVKAKRAKKKAKPKRHRRRARRGRASGRRGQAGRSSRSIERSR
jgi:DNA-binding beta-propeller fold protein YncE